jgi:hypothetical protein
VACDVARVQTFLRFVIFFSLLFDVRSFNNTGWCYQPVSKMHVHSVSNSLYRTGNRTNLHCTRSTPTRSHTVVTVDMSLCVIAHSTAWSPRGWSSYIRFKSIDCSEASFQSENWHSLFFFSSERTNKLVCLNEATG